MKFKIKNLIFVTKLILLTCLSKNVLGEDKDSVFLSADFSLYDHEDQIFYGEGNVKILRYDNVIVTDRILYDVKNDLVFANGDVIIYDKEGRVSIGNSVLFKNKFNQGLITNLVIKWDDDIVIAASAAKKIDKDRSKLYKATFTPCKIVGTCNPIWQISAKRTDINFETHLMQYQHVFFKILGVPIFYTPYFSHPTPHAPAKSGILVPSIENNNLKVPLYYRAKPNIDFTFSPRIADNYTVYEIEMRHKIHNGSYKIKDHYGFVPFKNHKKHSNYFAAKGEFIGYKGPYGFDLNFVSDKAFLQNYNHLSLAYLTSRVYTEHIADSNYYLIESLYYRDLKITDVKAQDPIIFPRIKTKNVIPLSFTDNCYFKIESNSLTYTQTHDLDLARGSILFSLVKDFKTEGGHLIKLDLTNRDDIYVYRNADKKTNALRNIPQAQVTWSYPLLRSKEYSSLLLEPVISGILSPEYRQNYIKKFALIDPALYDLSEINIFSGNKYSGIDHHESGSRISYGINSELLTKNHDFNMFLGQFLLVNNKLERNDRVNNIGAFNISIFDNFGIFYNFRKDYDFKSIKDEVGLNINYDKINFTSGFIKLENIKKYYLEQTSVLPKNHLKQGYYNIDYMLSTNWTLGNEMQFDLYGKSMKLISRSIRVTYFKDCVKINVVFYDNFTHDQKLGVQKTRNKTFVIGLKTLNM